MRIKITNYFIFSKKNFLPSELEIFYNKHLKNSSSKIEFINPTLNYYYYNFVVNNFVNIVK